MILYELLTGGSPNAVTGSMPEVLDRILHAEATAPSKVDSHRRLAGSCDDEIDTIVLKALAKDRERRYQTAGDLGRDVERYLAGDTIEAKRDSALYVLRKTLRRYCVPLGVACAFVFVLTAVAVFSTYWWRRDARLAEERRQAVYASHVELAQAAYDSHQMSWMKDLLYSCPRDLRGWEWYFLQRLSDRSRQTLRGHEHWLRACALSPDGRQVASASLDNTIRIWDVATGADVSPGQMTQEGPCCVAFAPDGEHLASGGEIGRLMVWDVRTGRGTPIPVGLREALNACAFSPDGQELVVGCRWPPGSPECTRLERERLLARPRRRALHGRVQPGWHVARIVRTLRPGACASGDRAISSARQDCHGTCVLCGLQSGWSGAGRGGRTG